MLFEVVLAVELADAVLFLLTIIFLPNDSHKNKCEKIIPTTVI
jgi:hypothetical protein